MVTPAKEPLKAKRMLKLSVLTKTGVLVQDEIGNIKSLHQESQRAESTQVLQWSETAGTGSAGTKAPTALEENEGLRQPSQASSQSNKRDTCTAEGDSVKREYTGADNSGLLFLTATRHTTHPRPCQGVRETQSHWTDREKSFQHLWDRGTTVKATHWNFWSSVSF